MENRTGESLFEYIEDFSKLLNELFKSTGKLVNVRKIALKEVETIHTKEILLDKHNILGMLRQGISEWSKKSPVLKIFIASTFSFLAFLENSLMEENVEYNLLIEILSQIFFAWSLIIFLELIFFLYRKVFAKPKTDTFYLKRIKKLKYTKKFLKNDFPDFFRDFLEEYNHMLEKDEKERLKDHYSAALIGTLIASSQILPIDVLFYLKVSLLDLLTRILLFLIPYSLFKEKMVYKSPNNQQLKRY